MYSTICQLQKVMCKQWLMLLPYTEQYSKIIDLLKEPPSGRVNNYIHIAYPGTSTSLYEFNHAVRSINIVDSNYTLSNGMMHFVHRINSLTSTAIVDHTNFNM